MLFTLLTLLAALGIFQNPPSLPSGIFGPFALTIFVILDLEYPRLGLIRVEAADQVLVDLRAAMT